MRTRILVRGEMIPWPTVVRIGEVEFAVVGQHCEDGTSVLVVEPARCATEKVERGLLVSLENRGNKCRARFQVGSLEEARDYWMDVTAQEMSELGPFLGKSFILKKGVYAVDYERELRESRDSMESGS